MIRVLILLCCAVAAFAQAPAKPATPPKPGRMEGIVVSTTGAPIARATVRLQGGTRVENGQAVPGSNYSATTTEDGKFVLENIEPSRNLGLTATRTGFVNARYGQRTPNGPTVPLVVEPGDSLTGLTITMTPQAVISGRVTDPLGDPVQGVQVALQRRGYQRGVRQLVTQNTVQSNDLGEFRVANLTPGRYYILVTDRRGIEYSGGTVAIPTYYPSGTDARSAAPIDLTAGQDMRGVEIRLRQAKGYFVRGKLVDGAGAALGNTYLLQRRGEDTNFTESRTRADGTFEIRGLPAGIYSLEAVATGTGTRSLGKFNVTVTDDNISNLILTAAAANAAAKLTGRMSLENGNLEELLPKPNPNAANSAQVTAAAANAGIPITGGRPAINLNSSGPTITGTQSGVLKPDGTFVIENVTPGKYTLNVSALPSGTYLKTAQFSGSDAVRNGIEFSNSAEMTIVLGKNPAGVNGTVQNEKGEAQAGIMVTLWSADPEPGLNNNGIRTLNSDRSGAVNIDGLHPGTYYMAAWEDIESGLTQVREFLDLMRVEAVKLELKEGAKAPAQLKIVPLAKIQATEEKLP